MTQPPLLLGNLEDEYAQDSNPEREDGRVGKKVAHAAG
jgi:hypothetical protein